MYVVQGHVGGKKDVGVIIKCRIMGAISSDF